MAQFPTTTKADSYKGGNSELLACRKATSKTVSVSRAVVTQVSTMPLHSLSARWQREFFMCLMLFVFSRLPIVSHVATIYMRPTNQFCSDTSNILLLRWHGCSLFKREEN